MKRKIMFAGFILICACALYFYAHHSGNPLRAQTTIDRIVVQKSARRLSIFRDGKQIKTYRIALGGNPVGAKQEEGDMKTPEGMYGIDARNPKAISTWLCTFPTSSADDEKGAAANGVSAGSDIMIHGIRNGRRWIGGVLSLERLDSGDNRDSSVSDHFCFAPAAGRLQIF